MSKSTLLREGSQLGPSGSNGFVSPKFKHSQSTSQLIPLGSPGPQEETDTSSGQFMSFQADT